MWKSIDQQSIWMESCRSPLGSNPNIVVVAVLYQLICSATRPLFVAYSVVGRLLAIVWIVAIVGLVDQKMEESVGQSAVALCIAYTKGILEHDCAPPDLARGGDALDAYGKVHAPLIRKLRDRFEVGIKLPMARILEEVLREAGTETDLERYAAVVDATWAVVLLATVFTQCKAVVTKRPGVLTFLTKAAIVGTSAQMLTSTRSEKALQEQLTTAIRLARPLFGAVDA